MIYVILNYAGWSDINGLDSNSPEDAAGFAESADRVNALIEQEISKNNIDPKRIVVAGFSQGGALALHVSLRYPVTLGGCVALSSWLPLRDDYPAAFSDAQSQLPILQVHGDAGVLHYYCLVTRDQFDVQLYKPLSELRLFCILHNM
jgi:predicted esterase